ncbi:unnamed protein product [Leptosia nina]|uniref:Uncharacterized protein n=1 Tax=Leptosia nina TaxID=320188 RepID=A0AAV1JHG0_9NEOP
MYNAITFLVLHALLWQHAYTYCAGSRPSPRYPSPTNPTFPQRPCASSSSGPEVADGLTSSGVGTVSVYGDMPVSGATQLQGQVPVMGVARFSGSVPAYGTVTICGSCSCGCD